MLAQTPFPLYLTYFSSSSIWVSKGSTCSVQGLYLNLPEEGVNLMSREPSVPTHANPFIADPPDHCIGMLIFVEGDAGGHLPDFASYLVEDSFVGCKFSELLGSRRLVCLQGEGAHVL